jgi:pSer/pThr/pTyr-binding forkhead associated (FHA) protein
MPMLPDGMVSGMPSGILAPLTRLEVISGPHLGLVFALTPGAIIGRDPRSDIPLVSDLQASRQHARLVPDPSGWRIEDGGSSNGTWVNGQRIANHPLQPGDQIGIGQSILRVV